MRDFNTILLEVEEGIAILTINRPDKLNALSFEVMNELKVCINSLHNNSSIHGLIITGSGEKSFVAGADIAEIAHLKGMDHIEVAKNGQDIFLAIEQLNIPVIAAINGYALGGGCELALACHVRVASKNAMFGQPEVNLGIIPGYGGTVRLPEVVGKGHAMDLILSGKTIDANEAYRIGLVTQLIEEDIIEESKKILQVITLNSPIALASFISVTHDEMRQEKFDLEAERFAQCCTSADFEEGAKAFFERRKPNFRA